MVESAGILIMVAARLEDMTSDKKTKRLGMQSVKSPHVIYSFNYRRLSNVRYLGVTSIARNMDGFNLR